MKKTAIFFGSSNGNTEEVATKIGELLDAKTFDVGDMPSEELANYDNLIFGSSTSGIGDLQDDWEEFISEVEQADLSNKTVAIFGLGDSESFSDSFAGCMEKIYEVVKEKDCKIVGAVSTEGYTFDDSPSVIDGKFVGLAIDQENEDDLTEERINKWLEAIKPEL